MTEQVTAPTGLPEQTGTAAETPAVESAVVTTPEQEAQPTGQAAESQDKPQQSDANKDGYIRRLQAQRAKARAEADRLARDKAELEARLQAQQPQPKPGDGRPKPEDFQDYNEFIRADAAHVAQQETVKALQRAAAFQAQQAQQQAAAKLEESWTAKQDKARDRHADYDESVDWLTGQIPQAVLPVLAHSEHGADLLYYFGKHPDELERIQALPPVLQQREAWLLEQKARPVQKQTQAPPPIDPVKSTGTQELRYRSDMTQDEYSRLRAKRKGRQI